MKTTSPDLTRNLLRYSARSGLALLCVGLTLGTPAAARAAATALTYTNNAADAWTTSTSWSPNNNWSTGTWKTNATNIGLRLNIGNSATTAFLTYNATMGNTTLDCSNAVDKAILVGYSVNTGSGVLKITGGKLRTQASGPDNAAVALGGGSSAAWAGRADLIIDGGILDASGNEVSVLWRGTNTATSTLTITNNGSMTNDTLSFAGFNATAYGTATVNLSGGTLTTRRITALHSAPNSTVNFNGTRLIVGGPEISGSPLINSSIAFVKVLTGGAIIDTAGNNSRIAPSLLSGTSPDGGLTKLGNGTLTLLSAASFKGPIVVNQGSLAMKLPVPSTSASVSSNASLSLSGVPNGWTLANLALTNATLSLDYGPFNGNTAAALNVTNLSLNGTVTLNVAGTSFPAGDITLLSYTSKSGTGSFTLGTLPFGAAATLEDTGSSVVLHVTTASLQNLVWSGGDHIWQVNGGADWNNGSATYLEYPSGVGDLVTFDDTTAPDNVTISGVVKPTSITVDTTTVYTFDGTGSISGPATLTKSGNGNLQINTANDFSGTVTVNGGYLRVNNPAALGATNGGTVVNSGGTLELGMYLGSPMTISDETVTINGGGVNGALGALRGNQSSGDNVWAGPVILGSRDARIGAEDNGNLTVTGTITDGGNNYSMYFRPGMNGAVTVSGSSNSWGGDTQLYGSSDSGQPSTVRLGADNALPSVSRLVVGNCTLDLNGHSQISAGLTLNGAAAVSNIWSIVTSSGSGSAMLTLNPTNSQNFSGTVSGNLGICKQGASTQALSGTTLLTYTGPTIVNGGTLAVTLPVNAANSVSVSDGATLSVTVAHSSWSPSAMNLTNAILSFNFGTLSGTPGPVFMNAALNVSGSNVVNIAGANIPVGQIPLISYSGGSVGGQFYLGTVPTGMQATIDNTGSAIVLNVTASPQTLTWSGANTGTWNTNHTPDWTGGLGFYQEYANGIGDMVTFDDTSTISNVGLTNIVRPYSVTVSTSNTMYTFSGPGKISGSTGLTKRGASVLTLATANDYTGGTVLSAGTINFASGALGSTSNIVLNGATTLQWAPGNTQDLSGRLRIDGGYNDNSHLAVLDVGTNNVAFTNGLSQTSTGGPITNTVGKVGSGTLTLAGGVSTWGSVTRVNNGTLEIATGATLNVDGAGNLANAALVADYSTILVSGGTVNIGDRLAVATMGYSTGTVTIASGTVNVEAGSTPDYSGLRLAGGTSPTTNNLATVNLDGGVLTVQQIFRGQGSSNTSIFNFNGGVLKPSTNVVGAKFMTNLTHAYVKTGGAIFDTDGTSVTVGQALEHDSGVAIDGGLTTRGSGTLVLAGTNTYNGPTVVSNNSTLLVRRTLGTNLVTVCAGATFGGSGTIGGPVIVSPGGTLQPGISSNLNEVLTINGALQLQGTTLVQIGKSGLSAACDGIAGVTDLTYGGNLVVTNADGSAIAAGDVFTLFAATGAKAGNFANAANVTVLPASLGLTGSFDPSTGKLTLSTAVTETPPSISSIAPSSGRTNGGTLITVTGSGFLSGLTAQLDGQPALASWLSDTQATVVTPAHAPGVVNLVLSNTNGLSATTQFTYVLPPPPATLKTSSKSGSALHLVWTGGTNQQCLLYTATNVALPRTDWSLAATNQVGADGLSTNDLSITPGEPKRFYLLSIPYN